MLCVFFVSSGLYLIKHWEYQIEFQPSLVLVLVLVLFEIHDIECPAVFVVSNNVVVVVVVGSGMASCVQARGNSVAACV